MKNKFTLAASIVILATSTIIAQEVPTKQKNGMTKEQRMQKHENNAELRAQKHVDGLNKDVELTADQQTKVKDLALAKIKKVDEIKAKYANKPEAKEEAKKEMTEARKDYRKSVKAILTPEQMEKLKAKKAKHQAGIKNKTAAANTTAQDASDDVEEILAD